jgi:ethanolamine ammonia-lyase small subunit
MSAGEFSWPELPWLALSRATPARIGLGRSGAGLPTAAHLDFQLAHARARDAVHAPFDPSQIAAELQRIGLDPLILRSAAGDRSTYLRRPDLGRRLDEMSRALLATRQSEPIDLVFIIADGLSAHAVHAHAVPLIGATMTQLSGVRLRIGPVAVVTGGRVAIGDEIGALIGADLACVLIGERPGLSAANSLGAYITWQPAPGTVDAARHCVSNIRPAGLPIISAANRLIEIFTTANRHRMTGVALAARLAAEAGSQLGSATEAPNSFRSAPSTISPPFKH